MKTVSQLAEELCRWFTPGESFVMEDYQHTQEVLTQALAEKDKEIARLLAYQKQHAGDCTFYSSVINGTCWDGICTCGYGWELWRKGVLDQMISAERAEAIQSDKAKDKEITKLHGQLQAQCEIVMLRDREIAKLMNDVSTNDIEYTKVTLESLAKDKRIAELEGTLETCVKGSFGATEVMAKENMHLRERNKAMAALLDVVPHDYYKYRDVVGDLVESDKCRATCPACAWARLREPGPQLPSLSPEARQTPQSILGPAPESSS